MGFEYDEYSTTMSEHHKAYVMEQFKRMMDNGYIYEKEEMEDYCETCQKFLADREISGTCPYCGGKSTGDQCEQCNHSLNSSEVLDKHCIKCGQLTTSRPNKHLYFTLPKFEGVLQDLINKNKFTWRKNALGEAQKYIDMGLVDRAATRQLDWGVPVPVPGYEDKRIYVWFEAVLGYLSVGKEVAEKRGIDFDKFMLDDNENLKTYYVHGKDNIPFHTTIYPAILASLKYNYRLPDYIVSSAYVNLNNEKMSKSKGNLITANELLEMFGSDTVRFYFAFKGPETNDVNCSIDDIVQTHNKFLVGMLGNFVNRNLSFIAKKFDGNIKEGIIDDSVKELTQKTYQLIGEYFEKGEIKNAVGQMIEYISMANKYYDSKQPWVQVKENIDDFNDTIYTCCNLVANLANLYEPFMPKSSKKVRVLLGIENASWNYVEVEKNKKISGVEPLFERI